MAKPIVLNEEPITMASVKIELEKIKERDGELNFRANKTEEYLQHFAPLPDSQAKELHDKIQSLEIPRLKPTHITKLIDILPRTPEDVKFVLQGYQTLTVTQPNIVKISDAIKGFL